MQPRRRKDALLFAWELLGNFGCSPWLFAVFALLTLPVVWIVETYF
jgi:hypothetical protein